MSGRIQVTGPDGAVTEAGDERRYDTGPRAVRWNRFTLTFADGGRLVLRDPRRLGRVRLNPDLSDLGPDAAQVTPAEFRTLITKGGLAVKARLLDQSKIAGVGNLLADEILWQAKVSPLALTGTLTRGASQSPVPGAEVRPGRRHRQRRRAYRRDHTRPAPWRHLPARRCADGARHGRRPVHLVVLPRAGPVPAQKRRPAANLY